MSQKKVQIGTMHRTNLYYVEFQFLLCESSLFVHIVRANRIFGQHADFDFVVCVLVFVLCIVQICCTMPF
jgi:hypothetical protein